MEEYTDVIYEKHLRRNNITSYGLILYTIIEGEIYYLVAQQRDSVTVKEIFHQVIREPELLKYASALTMEEKVKLQRESFTDLLDDIFVNCNPREYHYLSNNGEVFRTNIKNLKKYLDDEKVGILENAWIFPRGRKRFNESEINCVLREATEETGINRKYINIYNETDIYEEFYVGLNKKMYHIVYYLGYIHHNKTATRSSVSTKYRTTLSDEISVVKWLPYEEAIKLLDLSKQCILKSVNTLLALNLKRNHIQRRHSF